MYRVEEPDLEVGFHTPPQYRNSYPRTGAGWRQVVRPLTRAAADALSQWAVGKIGSAVSEFRTRRAVTKVSRAGERAFAIPAGNSRVKRELFPTEMVNMKRAGIGGGAVWKGRFPGRIRRPGTGAGTYSGYGETVLTAGNVRSNKCAYLGISSYPFQDGTNITVTGTTQTSGCSRMFKDIMIALVRHYFRVHHPGHISFETPDQKIYELQSVGWTSTQLNNVSEDLHVIYQSTDGKNVLATDKYRYINDGTGSSPNPIYTTIRELGNIIAEDMYDRFQEGYVPTAIRGTHIIGPVSSTYYPITSFGIMRLEKLKVKASCVTVLKVHNESAGEDGSLLSNSVRSTPIYGKVFYFNRVCPQLGAGFDLDGTVDTPDEWGARNLRRPLIPQGTALNPAQWNQNAAASGTYIGNIFAPEGSATPGTQTNPTGGIANPTGCWSMVPKDAYFNKLKLVKPISMEPGTANQLSMRFKFFGTLTDWLSRDTSNFSSDTASNLTGTGRETSFNRGMGQCALLVVEKRIRDFGSTQPVNLSFEVSTHLYASVHAGSVVMTRHIESNAN